MRVLLVEDEANIREGIKINLELEGYEVVEADTGTKALKAAKEQHFDIIIMDVMLPEIDGFQVCEHIRINNTDVPIIFLTAKDQPHDRIAGLKMGGDDYLTKPFHLEELLLRISKLLERTKRKVSELEEYNFGDNEINFRTYEASTPKGKIVLTKKEAHLLKMLIERKNEVVSRQQILQTVWGYDIFPSTRTIDNFILSFRKYFERDPKNPQFFKSVRGIGYKFIES